MSSWREPRNLPIDARPGDSPATGPRVSSRVMVRFFLLALFVVLAAAAVIASSFGLVGWIVFGALVLLLIVLALHDYLQTRHAILRNYPVLGRMRYLLGSIRPEIQQ